MKIRKRDGKYLIIGLALVFIDQITKIIFSNYQYDFGLFAFNYVQNTGITFGLMQGVSNLVIIISFLALAALYYYRAEFKEKLSYTMLISGIIGNLIDRILRGYVVDFLDFKIWPVFNIADILIVSSVFIIIYLEIQNSSKSSKASK